MTAFRYLNDISQTHKLRVSYRKQEENPFAREVLLDTKRTPINEICAVAELLRRDFCNCCRRYRQGREGYTPTQNRSYIPHRREITEVRTERK